VGDRTELCGTLSFISLGIDISPSTKIVKFLCERSELISLTRLVENSTVDNLYNKPGCHKVSKTLISKCTAAVDFNKAIMGDSWLHIQLTAVDMLLLKLRVACCWSWNYVTTDGQSVSTSWFRAQILIVWKLLPCRCGVASLTRGRVCLLLITVSSNCHCQVYLSFFLFSFFPFQMLHMFYLYIQYIQGGLSQHRLSTADMFQHL
jgi:hypothetical protein